jgi:hypothetical protein
MAEQTDVTAVTQTENRFKTVTLSTPIIRGTTSITKLNIRKPKAGQLRGGITLQDILTTDVTAMLKLIPRVTDPPLLDDESDNLEPDDFSEICGTIRGFFMTKAEHAAIDALMAEHRPKT